MTDAPVPVERQGRLRAFGRLVGGGLLGLATLVLLQFAVQAALNSPLQGLLSFLATGAFAVATYRLLRHQPIAGLLFLATMPLFLFSVVATFLYPDESPIYAVVTAIPPLASGCIWFAHRSASGAREG